MSNSSAPLFDIDQLRIGYHGRALLPPVSFELRENQFWMILGPNGAGKSTLIRSILGLLRPLSGSVARREGIHCAYIPQQMGFDPIYPLRVRDVLRMGCQRGWSSLNPFSGPGRAEMEEALADVGVPGVLIRRFFDLSDGQKQRVMVARALVSGASLIVMDEPTAAMDPQGEEEILRRLAKLAKTRPLAILMITHYADAAPRYATHVLYLDNHTQVVLAGEPDEVFSADSFRHRYAHHLHDECCDPPGAGPAAEPAATLRDATAATPTALRAQDGVS
ncbi:MAG: metal ABC transporter ATP-binding protein [Myxococcales bacterium]|nr:metal ABC transporter ATP-binding protein [Myxococcales bacterium]